MKPKIKTQDILMALILACLFWIAVLFTIAIFTGDINPDTKCW